MCLTGIATLYVKKALHQRLFVAGACYRPKWFVLGLATEDHHTV